MDNPKNLLEYLCKAIKRLIENSFNIVEITHQQMTSSPDIGEGEEYTVVIKFKINYLG